MPKKKWSHTPRDLLEKGNPIERSETQNHSAKGSRPQDSTQAGLPKDDDVFQEGNLTLRFPPSSIQGVKIKTIIHAFFFFCYHASSMAFDGLLITEIFYSLQGETSLIGVPFVFIRLTGCNLRCTYCDSVYSYKGGHRLSLEEVLAEVKRYRVQHVLLTGGEPLLQRNTLQVIGLLQKEGYTVSIETHGEAPIEAASRMGARIVMDIKTPGSKENRGGFEKNLPHLKSGDEIKFVITSRTDYLWAKDLVMSGKLPQGIEVLFSPAMKAENAPGTYEGIDPRTLADLIVQDQLPVRFQWQLHKLLWGADTKGV